MIYEINGNNRQKPLLKKNQYLYTSGARRSKHEERIHSIKTEVLATLDDRSYDPI